MSRIKYVVMYVFGFFIFNTRTSKYEGKHYFFDNILINSPVTLDGQKITRKRDHHIFQNCFH